MRASVSLLEGEMGGKGGVVPRFLHLGFGGGGRGGCSLTCGPHEEPGWGFL